jgi:UDP-N-acetylmuramoylalanine--D-glutamate ligase
MNLSKVFKGTRITQMGLGLLGRGIGDARFLASQGADVLVTDTKTEHELASSLEELADCTSIQYRLGEHRSEDFEERDLILKGAGVPLDSTYIAHARTAGVPVDMSASLFARIAPIPLIGVTGTRGKSTVTHLLNHILSHAGEHVILGGNVRGVSNLALLESVQEESVGVFELDSWQLQGFGEAHSLREEGVRQGPLSPHIAVFTTLMPDHMNYYNDSMDAYLADKAHIFLHQHKDDICIIGRQVEQVLAPYKERMQGRCIVADETTVPHGLSLNLPGIHNRYNAGLAVAAAQAYGVRDTLIEEALLSFTAVPGRLEYVQTIRGVRVYNDNNATTPDATAAALRALDPNNEKNIVLICGGSDKGLALDVLEKSIRTHVRTTICIPGSGTLRFEKELPMLAVLRTKTLEEALLHALSEAHSTDIILFSPGFASFGQYRNEYERNDHFMALLKEHA